VPTVANAVRMPAPCYLLMGLLGLAMRQAEVSTGTVSVDRTESATSAVR